MEKLVGLLAPARMYDDPNPRRDEYYFGNNYSNRIYDLGATPLGILPSDGYVSEKVLERFDSFAALYDALDPAELGYGPGQTADPRSGSAGCYDL